MGGDVRVGLQCLQKAGRLAQRDGKKLSASHVRKVLLDVTRPRQTILESMVNEDEKAIVEIVKKHGPLSFTEMYEKYSKRVENPASVRMVQNYLNHLVDSGMVGLSEEKVAGKRMIHKV